MRTRTAEGDIVVANVPRVGVGEVFIVVGHSVAQGGDLNLPGSNDDRVNTVALDQNQAGQIQEYERTGSPQFLPQLTGSPFVSDVKLAPFGHGTYFWARFGELMARKEDVPILIFNAAFGGTSLIPWAKSAQGEAFEHSFVKSALRMPYINLFNTLRYYVNITGVRAILADQGQNDADEVDPNVVAMNYRAWVAQARRDLGYARLAVVVTRQTPYPKRTNIRKAQEQVIREVADCFAGPDYDRLPIHGRYDRIHLSPSGAE